MKARPGGPGLRGFLFDVDGTLYDQRALRLHMALEWGVFALSHGRPAIDVWRSIMAFRRTREALRALGQPADRLEDLQYTEAARRAGIDEARLRAVVEEWILTRPLRHVHRCRRAGVAELFASLGRQGLRVGVVSDYPAGPKLVALQLSQHVSVAVCTTDAEVNAFKPHPAGLTHACRTWGLRPDEVLYVGDRPDVDGTAAAAIGMPCVIVGGSSTFHGLARTLDG